MSEDQDLTALCPKCGEPLIYVASVPHPKSPAMQRTTVRLLSMQSHLELYAGAGHGRGLCRQRADGRYHLKMQ